MATAKPAARKRTTRRRPAARTPVSRRPPRQHGWAQRVAAWCAGWLARHAASHRNSVRSRRDAAILRQTHANCQTCHGTGTLFTKGRNGEFTGSKPCPAKPATITVSKTKVAIGARFGVDKHSGLVGWRCPCGKSEKPRYRSAKDATAALRTHERQKHGGHSVGGGWYAQIPEGVQLVTSTPSAQPKKTAAPKPAPVAKTVTDSGLTNEQWEKQNSRLSPEAADRKGVCWQCAGQGKLHHAFGGEQQVVVCNECNGKGSLATTARTS